MNESKFVIVGGGMVAGYAAKQLVELGLTSGELAILSADTSVPYERPPLSKDFLAGRDTEESIRINSAAGSRVWTRNTSGSLFRLVVSSDSKS
jgi:NAD(P)H-nitrite reductase large subunit